MLLLQVEIGSVLLLPCQDSPRGRLWTEPVGFGLPWVIWPPRTCRSPLRHTRAMSVVVGPTYVAVRAYKEQLIRSRHTKNFDLEDGMSLAAAPLRQRRFFPRDPSVNRHITALKQRPLNHKRGWTTTFVTPEWLGHNEIITRPTFSKEDYDHIGPSASHGSRSGREQWH